MKKNYNENVASDGLATDELGVISSSSGVLLNYKKWF
jgi:hypothetical protein